MKALYWTLILIVSLLLVMICQKIFSMTFGIKPVLVNELIELKIEKRNLTILIVIATTLFFIAMGIALVGGF